MLHRGRELKIEDRYENAQIPEERQKQLFWRKEGCVRLTNLCSEIKESVLSRMAGR